MIDQRLFVRADGLLSILAIHSLKVMLATHETRAVQAVLLVAQLLHLLNNDLLDLRHLFNFLSACTVYKFRSDVISIGLLDSGGIIIFW